VTAEVWLSYEFSDDDTRSEKRDFFVLLCQELIPEGGAQRMQTLLRRHDIQMHHPQSQRIHIRPRTALPQIDDGKIALTISAPFHTFSA